tara:strand:+ start:1939 stop:2667 length:729 start_codon:yes stop_codon:yes gene_type:complete
MKLACITGLVNKSELNNVVVNVDTYTDGRYNCWHKGRGVRVKKENLLFTCEHCRQNHGAIKTVCEPELFLCDVCVFIRVSKQDIQDDIIATADAFFNRPSRTFTVITNDGTEEIDLYHVMVRFFEQVMCGNAEETFYVEPLMFTEGVPVTTKASSMALHILTEREFVHQTQNLCNVVVLEKITHSPVTVTFITSGKKFALEYWGFRPIDGSDGHHLGGLFPLALSNVMCFNTLWCSVCVKHK